ncbi:MAG TPA: hypothetical protein VKX28_03750 [Xanthobacteraceae bacterium]|jgi:hypothetical protein|nr:hypothetical protein [Xanthobacteraceae bacterium]
MADSPDRPGRAEDRADERLVRHPSDLIDFYRRWPEFRATAVELAARPDLTQIEHETVKWLIVLVDRIGDHDLKPIDREPKRRNR